MKLFRTPLHEEHIRLNARLVPFAGWEMPLIYRGIIPEHLHTREKASIFDICHMGKFEISGPTAEGDLERLLTQSIPVISEGRCAYGYLLAEDGGVLDDLICYRFSKEKFWLIVNAATVVSDRQWIENHLSPGTIFRNLSSQMAKLDIQGPSTRKEIENALKIRLPDIEYYHFRQLEMDGVQCILSRTGYTGEFGYELYLPSDQAVKFWRRILAQNSILPAGLGARDTLRVEMGYPLYGHELNRNHTPAGVTHRKFIDLNKSFIGREAVLRALEDEATRQLAGLRLEGRMAARPNDIILEDGHEIGKVTSGLFSPSLNVAVALGYLERQFASVGQRLNINSRGKNLTAEVVKLPFYKQGTAKL